MNVTAGWARLSCIASQQQLHRPRSDLRGCATADPLDPGFLQRIVDPHVSGPASSGEGVYTIMLNPCLHPSDEAPTSALQAHGSALADPRPAGGRPHSPVFEEPQMEGYRTVSASTGLAGVLPPAEDLLHGPAPHASPTGAEGDTRPMRQRLRCPLSACRLVILLTRPVCVCVCVCVVCVCVCMCVCVRVSE